jgi:hypothetical protein
MDFHGTPFEPGSTQDFMTEAAEIFNNLGNPSEEILLLYSDDPAAREAAGRLDGTWERLGINVEPNRSAGPLMLSFRRDAILLAMRLPRNGEGVLPQVLALYERSGWWEIAALAMGAESGELLRRARNLDPSVDLDELAVEMENAGLVAPIAKYDILFAPGPDVSLVPDEIYPGSVLWRAFRGTIPEPEVPNGENETETD